MGVGEVSASKACGGVHGSLPPPIFKNVPTPMGVEMGCKAVSQEWSGRLLSNNEPSLDRNLMNAVFKD